MKKTFSFGKIAYCDSRKTNLVQVDVELRSHGGKEVFVIDPVTREKTITGRTPKYVELSICGGIWDSRKHDYVCCGQCLDTIAEYREQLEDVELFDYLYDLWKRYHLNGMRAGTPEQMKAVSEWRSQGNRCDYTAECEMLKERGLYVVNYTGLSNCRRYDNEPYRYGTGWLVEELPGDVLLRVEHMLSIS